MGAAIIEARHDSLFIVQFNNTESESSLLDSWCVGTAGASCSLGRFTDCCT